MDIKKLNIPMLDGPNWGLFIIAVPATATVAEIAAYQAAKTVWRKKNAQGLGLIQGSMSPVIWQDHNTLGTMKEVLDALEAAYGAVGGGGINLPPIGQNGENPIHQFDGSVASNTTVPR